MPNCQDIQLIYVNPKLPRYQINLRKMLNCRDLESICVAAKPAPVINVSAAQYSAD